MLEVEVKLPVDDLDAVAARLRKLGADHQGEGVEEDTYFAHPTRDFAATDEALRVRTTPGGQEVTYKGPRQDATAKVRKELNVAFDGDLPAILEALDFTPAARVVKHRSTWHLAGAVVTLDRVDGVGTFVEVEVVGTDAAAASATVDGVVARLGLQDVRPEARSYLELQMSV